VFRKTLPENPPTAQILSPTTVADTFALRKWNMGNKKIYIGGVQRVSKLKENHPYLQVVIFGPAVHRLILGS
jgi:hypothetical protein